ncbi:MAG: head maturation protease, ClpP-related [Roseomonas sp.]
MLEPLPQARGAMTIDLFGDVGAEITAAKLAETLRTLPPAAPLTLRIFSYGGSAIEGLAIFNSLQRHQGKKTVIIDPLAASAASLIAMAGDEILMAENAFLMIHDVNAFGGGAAEDHRKLAENLDQVNAQYAKAYAARSTKPLEEVMAAMRAETWFDAEAAVAWGLADRIILPSEFLGQTAPRLAAAAHYRNTPNRFRLTERTTMQTQNQPAPQAAQTLQASVDELEGIAGRNGLGSDFILTQFKAGATREAALEAALERVAAHSPRPVLPGQVIGGGYADPKALRSYMTEALVARATGRAPSDAARPFAHMSLADLAAEMLERGGDRSMRYASPARRIAAALSTSDFPLLLTGTFNRIVLDTMEVAPGAARAVCGMRSVPDFRQGRFLQMAGMPSLARITEGAGITYAPPAERGESYAVQTFARQIQFTRQALVNDDLGAFDQARLVAGAVVATEAAEFVSMFATNGAGWGPTLSDGLPLFHATHNNVSTGTPGTGGISEGRRVMRGQTDARGNIIGAAPAIILVGPAGETMAEQAISDMSLAVGESSRPVFSGKLSLAVEPRLSGMPWFLFASPLQLPALAMVTLQGTNGQPQITQHETSDFDGLAFKVLHDFVIAPTGFVGAVRSTGQI